MHDSIAISVANVSKAYRIWENPGARLTAPILARLARFCPANSGLRRWFQARSERHYRDFWALQDVSFELKKGESMGIIGRNGSGKSTLLQIIAGTLQPSSGTIRVHGRVAALLELGSGFNPDFTGRENVYLNGVVLGLTRAEVTARFDQIAAFADIGDFLDQPVKTYSSGMMIRLAFAVAVSVEPEILIVDEALSVGDVFFQQKCFKRVHEMLGSGVTLLFVSHDTAAVQNLCSHAILLSKSNVTFAGRPEEVASRYYASSEALQNTVAARSVHVQAGPREIELQHFAELHNLLPVARTRHGSREMELIAAAVRNRHGLPILQVPMGESLEFIFLVRSKKAVAAPQAGLNVYDRFNNLVFAGGNQNLGYALPAVLEGDTFVLSFELTLDVQPGAYPVSLIVSEESADGPNTGTFYDVHESVGPIVVYRHESAQMPFYGMVRLPMRFTHTAIIASK